MNRTDEDGASGCLQADSSDETITRRWEHIDDSCERPDVTRGVVFVEENEISGSCVSMCGDPFLAMVERVEILLSKTLPKVVREELNLSPTVAVTISCGKDARRKRIDFS